MQGKFIGARREREREQQIFRNLGKEQRRVRVCMCAKRGVKGSCGAEGGQNAYIVFFISILAASHTNDDKRGPALTSLG